MNDKKPLILVVALAFIGFVAYNNFSVPMKENVFNPDYLYRGSSNEAIKDPKEYYNQVHGLTMSNDDSCQTKVVQSSGIVSIGEKNNILPLTYKGDKDADYVSLIGSDGSGLFKDGSELVMPVSSYVFRNSSIQNSKLEEDTKGRKDIEIMPDSNDGKYIIVFENVTTWWCHNHNTQEPIQHDKIVGNSSSGNSISRVNMGSIIGLGNDNTKIKVYKVKDELYNSSIMLRAKDVTKLDQLEQIHTGKFLVNMEEEIV